MVSGRNSILCSFYESFIKFGYQELFIHLSLSLFLESKRTWSFLMNLEKKSTKRKNQNLQWNFHWDGHGKPVKTLPFLLLSSLSQEGHGGSWWTWRWCQIGRSILWKLSSNFHQIFIKFGHQEPSHDSTCPISLLLESWRTWRFLMTLEMVSDRRENSLEASVKFSSRLDIRNPV